jgi:hypothetical protein
VKPTDVPVREADKPHKVRDVTELGAGPVPVIAKKLSNFFITPHLQKHFSRGDKPTTAVGIILQSFQQLDFVVEVAAIMAMPVFEFGNSFNRIVIRHLRQAFGCGDDLERALFWLLFADLPDGIEGHRFSFLVGSLIFRQWAASMM